ncbi:unnamed protein product [Protopolystoma xenopodis]|uniref:SARAH domain-containing protein n=1 Tax=Protopolystoma xenopodis TaxID=117903 RepID=A0A3S5B0K5_9PLAT|nr:unnamed protein product [Protopolystoma xenopodis]
MLLNLSSRENTDGNLASTGAKSAAAVAAAPLGQRPYAPLNRALHECGMLGGGGGINDPGGLARLSYSELEQLLVTLSNDLETELRNLAVRYRHKRQPLLDAIAEKTAVMTIISERGSVR